MIKIGLTGGIASGKSTVARLLRELGAPLLDADQVAREVVAPGAEAHAAVVAAFGPGILRPDGQIDRQALGDIVFADPAQRQRLEEIVHPAIRARMAAATAAMQAQGATTVVLDIPLLFESRLEGTVDCIWLVYVDRATQLQRLMARDGLDEPAAERRLAAQMPLAEKRGRAGVIIDNGGSLAATRRQVFELWQALLAQIGAAKERE